jgi:hypothetical protein
MWERGRERNRESELDCGYVTRAKRCEEEETKLPLLAQLWLCISYNMNFLFLYPCYTFVNQP